MREHGRPHPDITMSLYHLGLVYRKMGQFAQARNKHEESLELYRTIQGHGKPHPEIVKSLDNLGLAYRKMGKLDEALEKH